MHLHLHFLHYENPYSGLARYVTAQPPTQGADAGMYDASSEIHKLSTRIERKNHAGMIV